MRPRYRGIGWSHRINFWRSSDRDSASRTISYQPSAAGHDEMLVETVLQDRTARWDSPHDASKRGDLNHVRQGRNFST